MTRVDKTFISLTVVENASSQNFNDMDALARRASSISTICLCFPSGIRFVDVHVDKSHDVYVLALIKHRVHVPICQVNV
jgi:hypothetical protein